MVETCLDHYKAWTRLPSVLVSCYEDVLADSALEVRRIAKHLDLEISVDNSNQIAADYDLDEQQKRIEKFKQQLMQDPVAQQNQDREIVDYHDEETLLHLNHMSSGKMGQWRRELSSNQVERIEAKVKDWCSEHQYDEAIFLHSVSAAIV